DRMRAASARLAAAAVAAVVQGGPGRAGIRLMVATAAALVGAVRPRLLRILAEPADRLRSAVALGDLDGVPRRPELARAVPEVEQDLLPVARRDGRDLVIPVRATKSDAASDVVGLAL